LTERFADFNKRFDFLQRARNEFLPAESWVHGHHQNVVDDVQHFIEHVHRRCWIDDHGGFAAMRCDQLQCAMKVHAGFLVNGNPAGASLGNCGNEFVWIFDHQVAIENHFGKRFS
jgi:hypothetical protein